MLRRQFIKHGLVASTFLTGSLAALVPSIAHAEKTGSFKYGSQTINIAAKRSILRSIGMVKNTLPFSTLIKTSTLREFT